MPVRSSIPSRRRLVACAGLALGFGLSLTTLAAGRPTPAAPTPAPAPSDCRALEEFLSHARRAPAADQDDAALAAFGPRHMHCRLCHF